jgi:hypothetical protein
MCTNATASGTLTVTASCTNCQSWTTCTSTSSYQYNSSYGNKYYYYNGNENIQAGLRDGFTWISSVKNEGSKVMTWDSASTYCMNKGDGWRLPTTNELYCACSNAATLPGGYSSDWYWSASTDDQYETSFYRMLFNECPAGRSNEGNTYYVKCVK